MFNWLFKSRTNTLTSELIDLLIDRGPDSKEVIALIEKHKYNAEFVRIAELARKTKRTSNCQPRNKEMS